GYTAGSPLNLGLVDVWPEGEITTSGGYPTLEDGTNRYIKSQVYPFTIQPAGGALVDSVAFQIEVTVLGVDSHVYFTDGTSQFIYPGTGFQGFTSCGKAIERIEFYGPMGLDD